MKGLIMKYLQLQSAAYRQLDHAYGLPMGSVEREKAFDEFYAWCERNCMSETDMLESYDNHIGVD